MRGDQEGIQPRVDAGFASDCVFAQEAVWPACASRAPSVRPRRAVDSLADGTTDARTAVGGCACEEPGWQPDILMFVPRFVSVVFRFPWRFATHLPPGVDFQLAGSICWSAWPSRLTFVSVASFTGCFEACLYLSAIYDAFLEHCLWISLLAEPGFAVSTPHRPRPSQLTIDTVSYHTEARASQHSCTCGRTTAPAVDSHDQQLCLPRAAAGDA